MNEIDDHDWQLLNAYNDGELSAPERAGLQRRISREPRLAAALGDIRGVSAALGQLRPTPAPVAKARSGLWQVTAVAASFAAALVTGAAIYLMQPASPGSAQQWHASFLSQDYAAPLFDDLRSARVFGPGGAPDLSAANLALVDQRSGEDGAMALHYAGQNGCRLTLTAGFGADMLAISDADALSRSWIAGPVSFMVLATDMDPARFDAISVYIRQLTEQAALLDTVLAMRTATENAVPCGQA